mmetsp:Transcript_21138/g.53821  ORF Transcript_21138/g.53821 Transcript_21138/m.53821 type:complete len:288 (-) Transcript_21138:909-1772(-)
MLRHIRNGHRRAHRNRIRGLLGWLGRPRAIGSCSQLVGSLVPVPLESSPSRPLLRSRDPLEEHDVRLSRPDLIRAALPHAGVVKLEPHVGALPLAGEGDVVPAADRPKMLDDPEELILAPGSFGLVVQQIAQIEALVYRDGHGLGVLGAAQPAALAAEALQLHAEHFRQLQQPHLLLGVPLRLALLAGIGIPPREVLRLTVLLDAVQHLYRLGVLPHQRLHGAEHLLQVPHTGACGSPRRGARRGSAPPTGRSSQIHILRVAWDRNRKIEKRLDGPGGVPTRQAAHS